MQVLPVASGGRTIVMVMVGVEEDGQDTRGGSRDTHVLYVRVSSLTTRVLLQE